MCREQKFYICEKCGNLVGMIHRSGIPIYCCGQPMNELIPNTEEADGEKHLPVVSVSGNTVMVEIGSVEHPMTEKHFIQWIYIETKNGGQRKCLSPGDKPKMTFNLHDDKVTAAYAYCNLHGLWKTKVK